MLVLADNDFNLQASPAFNGSLVALLGETLSNEHICELFKAPRNHRLKTKK